jgi:AcrR family transcriptional regulator
MAAASELFAAHGYDGTTVDVIAMRAGVNKAMINYHFAGKQGLYTAILRRDFGWATSRLDELERGALRADAKLARFVSIFGELHLRRPGLSAILLREGRVSGDRGWTRRSCRISAGSSAPFKRSSCRALPRDVPAGRPFSCITPSWVVSRSSSPRSGSGTG